MGKTVYRVSGVRVVTLVLAYAVLALFLASPITSDYLRGTVFSGKWPFINGLTGDGRALIGYVAAGLSAIMALGFARFLFIRDIVTVDIDGIRVRHLFGSQSGYWDEFRDVKSFGLGWHKSIWLIFEGTRGDKKVHFPPPILGINLKTIKAELRNRVSHASLAREARARAERAAALDPHESRPIDPILGLDRLKNFGRRQAG